MNQAAVVSISLSLIHNIKCSFLANFSRKNPFFDQNLCQNISVDKIKCQNVHFLYLWRWFFVRFSDRGVSNMAWLRLTAGCVEVHMTLRCGVVFYFCYFFIFIYIIFEEISVKRQRTKTRNRTSRSRTLRLLSNSENRYRSFPFFLFCFCFYNNSAHSKWSEKVWFRPSLKRHQWSRLGTCVLAKCVIQALNELWIMFSRKDDSPFRKIWCELMWFLQFLDMVVQFGPCNPFWRCKLFKKINLKPCLEQLWGT